MTVVSLGNGDHRAAERQSYTHPKQCSFYTCRASAQNIYRTSVQLDVAGTSGRELARDHHEWKQERVPIRYVDCSEPSSVQKTSKGVDSVAPDIVHSNVMSRQQPAIGRQIENEPAVFRQTAVKLPQREMFIYATMAQDISADDNRKSTIYEWQLVKRSGADWASALGGCARAGSWVDIKSEHGCLRIRSYNPCQEPAGAATGIQHRGISRLGWRPSQQCHQVSVQSGEPPHPVFNTIKLVELGTLHARSIVRVRT